MGRVTPGDPASGIPARASDRPGPSQAGLFQTDLVLAGHRLRLLGSDRKIIDGAAAVMAPPCRREPGGSEAPAWTVDVDTGPAAGGGDDGLPAVTWPQSGRQLVVHRCDSGVIEAAGFYRRAAGPAWLETDMTAARTRLVLPAGDALSRRWPDWLARSFFGARLLCDGWVLLHASSVRVATPAGDRAVLVLAGSRGGKSALAYRACRELGAAHMADDLTLIRAHPQGIEVMGWPTRACVPVEVLDPALLRSLPAALVSTTAEAGRPRTRVILSPPQYGRLLGVGRAGPGLLGGIVSVSPAAAGPPSARAMTPGETARELAAAAHVPGQRAAMTDLVGLTGLPVPAPSAGRAAVPPADGIPAVAVCLPDMSLLPGLPVWDLIGGRIPGLDGAR